MLRTEPQERFPGSVRYRSGTQDRTQISDRVARRVAKQELGEGSGLALGIQKPARGDCMAESQPREANWDACSLAVDPESPEATDRGRRQ